MTQVFGDRNVTGGWRFAAAEARGVNVWHRCQGIASRPARADNRDSFFRQTKYLYDGLPNGRHQTGQAGHSNWRTGHRGAVERRLAGLARKPAALSADREFLNAFRCIGNKCRTKSEGAGAGSRGGWVEFTAKQTQGERLRGQGPPVQGRNTGLRAVDFFYRFLLDKELLEIISNQRIRSVS